MFRTYNAHKMNRTDNSPDLIFGIKPVLEGIRSGKEFDKILLQKGAQGEAFQELFSEIRAANLPFQHVPYQKLNRITRKNHQGVVAFISPVSFSPIEEVLQMVYERGETPLFVALDRVTDVRNFGAVVRSAEAMGAHGVLMPEKGSAQVNGDAVKTSAGALLRLPISRVRFLKDAFQYMKDSGIQIVGITEKAEAPLSEIDFTIPTCLIMGSEEDGISPEYLSMTDANGLIPMPGGFDSLNVSVAAGMALYEAARQRFEIG